MKVTKQGMLSFGEKNVERYRQLARELGAQSGQSKELSNREVFLIAMSWGFRNGVKVEDFKKSGTGARYDFLKDEDFALLAAIQLDTMKDPNTLLDLDQCFELAQQYAEGGILLLAKMMDEPGDFAKAFAAEVKQLSSALVPAE